MVDQQSIKGGKYNVEKQSIEVGRSKSKFSLQICILVQSQEFRLHYKPPPTVSKTECVKHGIRVSKVCFPAIKNGHSSE